MEQPVTIRIFESTYTEQVIDLILGIQIGEFQVPITRKDQPDLERIDAVYQQGNGNFWVALHGDAVVGTIAAIDFGEHRLALRKMFVHREFRGPSGGVAQMLWETLLTWSLERQIRAIYLGTLDRLVAAQKFYLKNGFEEIARDELPADFPVMAVDNRFFVRIFNPEDPSPR